jgi:hypothetical protein
MGGKDKEKSDVEGEKVSKGSKDFESTEGKKRFRDLNGSRRNNPIVQARRLSLQICVTSFDCAIEKEGFEAYLVRTKCILALSLSIPTGQIHTGT